MGFQSRPEDGRESSIPLLIDNAEVIVRGICSPFHVKKGKLLNGAFDPPSDRNDTSVMRHNYMSVDDCRNHSISLATPTKKYMGMAAIAAHQIRAVPLSVEDSRQYFLGHADILFTDTKIRREQDPASAQLIEAHNAKLKALRTSAKYYPDPYPESSKWNGDSLLPVTPQ